MFDALTIAARTQSQRPTVIEEKKEEKEADEDKTGFTIEELQEAEEIREKEVNLTINDDIDILSWPQPKC